MAKKRKLQAPASMMDEAPLFKGVFLVEVLFLLVPEAAVVACPRILFVSAREALLSRI